MNTAGATPTLTILADVDAERYAVVSGDQILVFQNASGVYRRMGSGDDAVYRNVTRSAEFTPERAVRSLVQSTPNRSLSFPFRRNGTATFDGERMARYTATDPGSFRGRRYQVRNVTGFLATALVDDRGVVRKVRYTIRGRLYTNRSYSETYTLTITGVGNTSVPKPDAPFNESDVGRGR